VARLPLWPNHFSMLQPRPIKPTPSLSLTSHSLFILFMLFEHRIPATDDGDEDGDHTLAMFVLFHALGYYCKWLGRLGDYASYLPDLLISPVRQLGRPLFIILCFFVADIDHARRLTPTKSLFSAVAVFVLVLIYPATVKPSASFTNAANKTFAAGTIAAQ
jgi:hypothetical protein